MIALSFLLLMLAFRTVVIPVQAAVMNLLSIGAAYGVLTAIFQWGWLHGLIGLDGAVPIVSYVPLFMFAVLFGLSMDYEVFLVSQIKEHVDEGQDNKTSVVSGLVTSAVVITAAASIMVFVFGGFVLNGDPTVKQFGIGLAIAVILDATVVRCLLVPARMVMLGKHNWYLPRWLGRILPRISIEGGGILQSPRPAPGRRAGPVFRRRTRAAGRRQRQVTSKPLSRRPRCDSRRGDGARPPTTEGNRVFPSPPSITRGENRGTSHHRPPGPSTATKTYQTCLVHASCQRARHGRHHRKPAVQPGTHYRRSRGSRRPTGIPGVGSSFRVGSLYTEQVCRGGQPFTRAIDQ